MSALKETSSSADAFERLRVRPTLVEHVLRNTVLDEIPTRRAAEVYAGSLYAGFDFGGLSAAARARTDSDVVIASALWGLLRPSDAIPPYRLHLCARLSGIDRIEPIWRGEVDDALADAAGDDGVILDLRSPGYRTMGRPTGMADRTVTIRVLPESGARSIGDVIGKRIRGEVARYLVSSATSPATPGELASALDERWPARLDPPLGPTRPWVLSVRPAD